MGHIFLAGEPSIHIVYEYSSFLIIAELYSIVKIHYTLCIPSPGDRDFDCFQFMAISEKDFGYLVGVECLHISWDSI